MVADPKIIPLRYGALPTEWASWCAEHGLTEDLLPVVSKPGAVIAPNSKLKDLGKVPSRYNRDGLVVGIGDWPQYRATDADIKRWSAQPDLGVCIQTRRLRALDIDVPDPITVTRILEIISESMPVAARRGRADSAKCLLPVWVEGDLSKRRLTLPDGSVVEFLAGGQQFIASGTHPKGARYEWPGGQPESFPGLELEEFEALWLRLRDELKAEDSRSRDTKPRLEQYTEAVGSDPVAQALFDQGRVLDTGRDGQLFVTCPNEAEHSTESGPTSTAYYPAHTGGYERGHWVCLHAHCAGRPDSFFTDLLLPIEFEDLTQEEGVDAPPAVPASRSDRFSPVPLPTFLAAGDATGWLIKHVMPDSGLVFIYGSSGAGKSFFTIDMSAHIGAGRWWQGHRVKQGRVVYLAAEGQGGIRRRLAAWCQRNGVDPASMLFDVIPVRPNFLQREDVLAVAQAIGRAALVIVDTLMAVSPGGDENSSQDMGRVLANLDLLGRKTGACIAPVSHAGKDPTRGQRGWSGLKGAADTEIEVSRPEGGDVRMARLAKVRDGNLEGHTWGFKLEDEVLGVDADGDEITSGVVAFTTPPATASKARKLGANQQIVMSTMADLVQLGEGVREADLLDAVVDQMSHSKGSKDNRMDNAKRALNGLVASQRLTLSRGIVRVSEN
jgi:hypothetical protein